MTRLPSDSFLPSGAMLDPNEHSMSFTSNLNGHSSASIISPLSLPHAINSLPYFDGSNLTNLPPPNYLHSPSVSATQRSRQQFLAPRQSLDNRDQRTASLSPTRYQTRSRVTSPSLGPTSNPGVASPLDNMGSQSLMTLLARREEQNKRLLESWHAERSHLEASRARAEEVYQEERAIFDEERMLWIDERLQLEKQLSEWKRRAEVAEKKREEMTNLVIGIKSRYKKSFDGAADVVVGSIRGGGPGSPGAHSQSSSNKFQSPSERLSPGARPPNVHRGSTMPESEPFIPLDPRMQGPSPGTTSPKTQQERIPSIDIQEVMPELEGIRVRPDAVQKPTFTDGKPSSPPSKRLSPTTKHDPARTRELIKEALQAPESDRLTMHAGHTPNHSMSLSRLHTVESTGASNTADSSGTSTPKNPPAESGKDMASEQLSQSHTAGPDVAPEATKDPEPIGDPLPGRLGPYAFPVPRDEDPELKGPLHLRNLPAADEPFLKSLSDKLEHARIEDATPTVLKNNLFDEVPQNPVEESMTKATGGGDGAHDTLEEVFEDQEEEIPLKLKKTNNFGQPLGQLGKHTAF